MPLPIFKFFPWSTSKKTLSPEDMEGEGTWADLNFMLLVRDLAGLHWEWQSRRGWVLSWEDRQWLTVKVIAVNIRNGDSARVWLFLWELLLLINNHVDECLNALHLKQVFSYKKDYLIWRLPTMTLMLVHFFLLNNKSIMGRLLCYTCCLPTHILSGMFSID